MTFHNRPYRKKLTTEGFIYLNGHEYLLILNNLSITGLLGELEADDSILDITSLFNIIQQNTSVDIYLSQLRLAGEAKVVRADLVNDRIYLALEFRDIEYDVDNALYLRHNYRKRMEASGLIEIDDQIMTFTTINVSVDGMMIQLPGEVPLEAESIVQFDFSQLELVGEARIVWRRYEHGNTVAGLEYTLLQKNAPPLPRFAKGKT
ncbi:MAG: PilZ domain-containing protein [Methylococcales bacterium]|nr:PilZ domain-containing protein [Methylococcales bacterium]